jgi:hydroxyacylglutathione hydrolase
MKNYEDILPAEAAARLAEFRVVDVRQPEEWTGDLGCILGSEFMPLAELDTLDTKEGDTRPVLLICRSGKRSEMGCELLQKRGFPSPHNLVGGMLQWDRLGLPVENRG